MAQSNLAPRHRDLPFMLAALSALGPFCIDAYLPSLTDLARDFSVPLLTAQQTLTAYMATFAVMTLWHGALSDAIGRRRVTLLTLGAFTLASLGCAASPDIGTLLFFRALQGMTAGAGMVVGRAIVRDLHQGPEAQRMMSVVSLVFAIAPAVAPIIGGWLHHFFGWRSVFVFMAVFAAAVFGWCHRALPETLPADRRQPFRPAYLARSYLELVASAPFVTACLVLAVGFAGFFVYVLSAPVFMMQHLGVAETEFVWLFGPVTVGMVVGSWLSGRLAGRLSSARTVAAGLGVMALAVAANLGVTTLLPPGLPWSVAPLFLYVLGMSLVMPSMSILALDLFPTRRGLAASGQGFIQSIGNSLNAALLAPAVWATTRRMALTQAGMFALTVVCFAVYLRGRPRQAT